MKKGLLISCLLLVSLISDAKVNLPDSLLTISKSYVYNITSPDTAQAILDVIRERQSEPAWRIDFAEGDLNINKRCYQKALNIFERLQAEGALRDSTRLQLLLTRRLMDCYNALGLHDDLIRSIYTLRKMAKASGDKAYESISLFMSGKEHHYHGHLEQGYAFCLDALEMLREQDDPNKHIELRNYYAELLRMYTRDGRYEEAMNMSRHQEVEALYPSPAIMLKASERGLRQVYALRASVLAHAGRMAEADKAYAAWKKTTCGNPIDDMDIYNYLRFSHHNDEALGVIVRYRQFLREQGDTLSYQMLATLNREALLRVDMGDIDSAVICGRQVARVAHELHIIKSGEQMQTTYNLLEEQSASHKKSMWLMFLFGALLIAAIAAVIILSYIRNERRHFRDMRKLVKVVDAYRHAIINGESKTSPQVVAAIEELRAMNLPEDVPSEGEEEPDDEDRRLFVEMDSKVTRDRLFLKPNLGRDDLMRLIGVDKNRFGKMMSKYSDASNTSVYINIKRVTYGAQLLVEHPEYTIATVATECGMNNTVTFNRTFKEIYNMTPSDYRDKFPLN